MNSFLRALDLSPSQAIDCPYKWYGGTKALECDLAIGAFNHLDLTGLIDHLRKVGGPFADELQLMVKEQEHNRFRMINIIDESAEAPV